MSGHARDSERGSESRGCATGCRIWARWSCCSPSPGTAAWGARRVSSGITQPAASSRIRSMERQLGVALVDRSPRGSRLTDAGALVTDWARRVVEAAEAFDAGAQALRGRRDSRLRVAASMTIAEYLLPGWLIALRAQRPGTAVSLLAGNSAMVAAAAARGRGGPGLRGGPVRAGGPGRRGHRPRPARGGGGPEPPVGPAPGTADAGGTGGNPADPARTGFGHPPGPRLGAVGLRRPRGTRCWNSPPRRRSRRRR